MRPPAERTPKDDLELARRLSRALGTSLPEAHTDSSRVGAPTRPQPVAPFARFGVAPHGPRVLGVGGEDWKRLLAEVLTVTHALSVFAIDESGLLVASSGLETEDAEGLGSRLIVAFEQLDRALNQPCRSITIDLGTASLTGCRGASGAGSAFTLVIRSQAALPEATRAAVMGLLLPVVAPHSAE